MITFSPRTKPGIQVTESIVQSATQPIAPTLASVVIGPQVQIQDPILISSRYLGSTTTYMFPSIEAAAKVKLSTVSLKFTDISVAVLGQSEILQGTVDSPSVGDPHAKRFISTPTKTGIMLGVRAGDKVIAVENVTLGSAGIVLTTSLKVLTQGTSFINVIAGDIISVTDAATARTVVANITSVQTGGTSITVDADLPAATGLTWSITRNFSAFVVSIPTDTKLELNKELSISGSVVNTFSVVRKLISTGTSSFDQPLADGIQVIPSTTYSLTTTSTTNDSFSLVSGLRVSGFNSFNAYPIVQLTSVQLEVDVSTTIIKNQITATTPLTFSSVLRVGDNIKLGVLSTTFIVTNINTSTNTITVNSSAGTAGDTFTSINVPEKNKLIVDAGLVVSYRALRTANANKLLEIGSAALTTSIAGIYHPENPLGVAATLQAASTGTITYVVPVESDDEVGYLKAFASLESKNVYSIAPLTQNLTIQGFAKAHADAMSTPIKAKWRVVFGNLAEPTEGTTPETKGASLILSVTAGIPTSTSTVFLYNSRANFSTGVNVGDYIQVLSTTGVSSTLPAAGSQVVTNSIGVTRNIRMYRVLEIINASKLKLEALPYEGSNGVYTNIASAVAETTTYIVGYRVIQVLSLSETAQTIANIAASFSDRRFIYVTNGSCILSFSGSLVELPGYYISAALSGLCSGTAPHQPLTNYPITGILGVRGGSEKYDDTQQGIIAAGGGWLVVQDALDESVPYTWQQLTTSAGDVKEQEFSFTKNLDEIAKAIVVNDRRFPGKNNNVAPARSAVDSQTTSVLDARLRNDVTSPTGGILGTQIISYTYGGLVQDPILKDVAFSDISVVLPLPLNQIRYNILALA